MSTQGDLCQALQAARRYGEVYVHIDPRPGGVRIDERELLDSFVAGLGLRPIGRGWREVDANKARQGLARIIGYDLAYDAATMEWGLACELTDRFMEQFSGAARYFTNAEPWVISSTGGRSQGSSPLTDATFDEAFLAVDDKHVGILMVMDED